MNAEVEKVERKGANVVFYFQSVGCYGDHIKFCGCLEVCLLIIFLLFVQVPETHTTIVVEFLRRFIVEDYQQSPVTLYDYYDPGS